ncbi:MAG: hypothetical protein ACYCV7_10035 [Acidimicrobiales bacterium]
MAVAPLAGPFSFTAYAHVCTTIPRKRRSTWHLDFLPPATRL